MSVRQELKNHYVFIATKDKFTRTVRVRADTYNKGRAKAKKKYPDWTITAHSKHYNSPKNSKKVNP